MNERHYWPVGFDRYAHVQRWLDQRGRECSAD
jgi:hypothetical protein